MPAKKLTKRIEEGILFLDGAMGTQLFERGAKAGICNENLNVESPEMVADVYRAYLDAGSDAIITNTFGATRIGLNKHGLGDKVSQINIAAAQLARKTAGADKYVLGGLGACGELLEPYGTLKEDELRDAFAQQATALSSCDIDGFIIETMTAVEEAKIAIEAIKSVSELPVLVSMSFDRAGDGFRTMMGVDAERAVSELSGLGLAGMGFNCGTLTMDEYIEFTGIFSKLLKEAGLPLIAETNAGKPELIDGQAVYSLSPEEFAVKVEVIANAGASLIGGCCGTTPEHIKAAVDRIRG
ncbi:MAG: homocysteine S-methyltransferase family protein [Planctomycetes bacterium]|nr:homocysteine S-methyltransferase family protein [Planctomycetota bacterium]